MDQFTAHLDRGWDLVNRGDLAGALLSAHKGLELDPESPEAHNLIGYIHQAEGRHEDALEHYRQAISIDETYVEAMLNAAEVLIHGMRDYENGLSMVDDALDFAEGADEVADAQLLRFDALMQQGDREAAEKIVKTLPEGPFEEGHYDFMIGRAKYEIGDLDGAERHLTRAVKDGTLDGLPSDAHYYHGLVREARNDKRGATISFLHAREADVLAARPAWALSPAQFERRVQAAIKRLPPSLAARIEDALVVVSDLPGPEVVADGVDPHITVLLEDLQNQAGDPVASEEDAERVGRVFVYQRNIERWSQGPDQLEDEILRAIEHEISLLFVGTT